MCERIFVVIEASRINFPHLLFPFSMPFYLYFLMLFIRSIAFFECFFLFAFHSICSLSHPVIWTTLLNYPKPFGWRIFYVYDRTHLHIEATEELHTSNIKSVPPTPPPPVLTTWIDVCVSIEAHLWLKWCADWSNLHRNWKQVSRVWTKTNE